MIFFEAAVRIKGELFVVSPVFKFILIIMRTLNFKDTIIVAYA